MCIANASLKPQRIVSTWHLATFGVQPRLSVCSRPIRPNWRPPAGLSIRDSRGPKTIRDAMTLVQKIGQSFLRVDALCIVQDDLDEMANQISSMGFVYSEHAKLILNQHALTMRRLCHIGCCCCNWARCECWSARDVKTTHASVVSTWREFGVEILSMSFPHSKTSWIILQNGVSAPAWTYQERVLSRRPLVIPEHQLYVPRSWSYPIS